MVQATAPEVVIDFSRNAFRLGSKAVGCIRIKRPVQKVEKPTMSDFLSSAGLVVAGVCRLDPRWQNSVIYRKYYQTHPSLSDCDKLDTHSVCFWATEQVELQNLKERTILDWNNVKPSPTRIEGLDPELQPDADAPELPFRNLKDEHLCFTFAVDLPANLPHTLNATSCRYSYHILLRLELANRPRDPIWMDFPFTVISSGLPLETAVRGSRVQVGPPAQVLRHSNGLPTHLSAADWYHRLPGRVMVNHESCSLYQNKSRLEPMTMRVADLRGQPVGVLTLMGCTVTSPSSRCIVKLDFPKEPQSLRPSASNGWTRCYQVCCCLQGEEIASQVTGTRKRARSYLLDTAQALVSDGTTGVSLELLVPLEAPCSVQTDLVVIAFRVLIDLTVSDGNNENKYQNLRLEVPCTIGHGPTAFEGEDYASAISSQPRIAYELSTDPTDPQSFPVSDLQDDMQVLSHVMAHKCRLLPVLRPQPSEAKCVN